MRKCRIVVCFLFSALFLCGLASHTYSQQSNGNGSPKGNDKENDLDIIALSQRTAESLYSNEKYPLIKEMKSILASEAPLDTKNQIALLLAGLMIHSSGSLNAAEELLNVAQQQIPESDFAMKAEAEYMLGVIQYARSQLHVRWLFNQRTRLILQGIGDKDNDPFLELATRHFDRVFSYPNNPSMPKARMALNALSNPTSYDGFQFYYAMGKMFDDNARLDTPALAKQYYRVIKSYEKGNIQEILNNKEVDVSEKVDVYNAISHAYFTTTKYQKALDVNKKGLDELGVSEFTSDLKFNRAYIHYYRGDFSESEKEYDDILNDFPLTNKYKKTATKKQLIVLLEMNKKEKILKNETKIRKLLSDLVTLEDDPKSKKQYKNLLEHSN